ncbi:hypothetical protein PIB30_035766 [Stylosanthes scabra]|uniref:Uncharacterized protein n=1 Tax=Stylosanthes scabra TaxID=79078 RepID=A0ABU6SDW9_9FABA|nr:hypothetical protein [Stylosanthes scabra]
MKHELATSPSMQPSSAAPTHNRPLCLTPLDADGHNPHLNRSIPTSFLVTHTSLVFLVSTGIALTSIIQRPVICRGDAVLYNNCDKVAGIDNAVKLCPYAMGVWVIMLQQ